ncbi:membrane protein YczE [Blastococcus sp. SYSU DS0541]
MNQRLLLAGAPATVGGTPRRLLQLYAGLALYGASMALLVRSALGVMPWDVLHQGLAGRLGWSLGTVTIAVGALVLLAWIPLRQRPGLGTVSNVLVIGLAVDATLAVLPAPGAPAARAGFLVAGVLLNAVATAAYIGVRLGPGPRDGLMTGLVERTGRSVRLVRTSVELGVVATGWLLGGTLGLGTVVYALAIGPLVQVLLPRLSLPLAGSAPAAQPEDHDGDDGEHEQRDRPAAAAGPRCEDQQ